eukprot:scaffold36004_cov150-Skeletonema_dohrnii-CCMP3373.AAC.1
MTTEVEEYLKSKLRRTFRKANMKYRTASGRQAAASYLQLRGRGNSRPEIAVHIRQCKMKSPPPTIKDRAQAARNRRLNNKMQKLR